MANETQDDLQEAEFLAKSEALESFWAIQKAENEEERAKRTSELQSRTDAMKGSARSEAYKTAWMEAFAAELERLEGEAPSDRG